MRRRGVAGLPILLIPTIVGTLAGRAVGSVTLGVTGGASVGLYLLGISL